jgi:hypothetical protein
MYRLRGAEALWNDFYMARSHPNGLLSFDFCKEQRLGLPSVADNDENLKRHYRGICKFDSSMLIQVWQEAQYLIFEVLTAVTMDTCFLGCDTV